jgi:hypothetical protein
MGSVVGSVILSTIDCATSNRPNGSLLRRNVTRLRRTARLTSVLPIRSKSSGAPIRPARKPSRRTCQTTGVSSGVTLTHGLPALAMTNGSPFAACSTSRESRGFTSWMLTAFIRTKFHWFSLFSGSPQAFHVHWWNRLGRTRSELPLQLTARCWCRATALRLSVA